MTARTTGVRGAPKAPWWMAVWAIIALQSACGAPPAPHTPPAQGEPAPEPPRDVPAAAVGPSDEGALSELVLIPAGEPVLGTRDFPENPTRTAYLSAFYIARTEVTVGAYAACVASGACPPYSAPLFPTSERRTDAEVAWMSSQCNFGVVDRSNHPMNCVTRAEAEGYCRAQGQRLPDQEEWEYAGRGLDARTFPWGANGVNDGAQTNGADQALKRARDELGLDTQRYYARVDDGFAGTAPVGSFPRDASPFGVLDLAGNVSEWTSTFQGELVDLHSSADPRGYPVQAGGDWMRGRSSMADLSTVPGDRAEPWDGFRCARDADTR